MNKPSKGVQNKHGDKMFIAIIRTALLYSVILAAVRLMGKRQISDLQTSELVVTMLLSDIASIALENTSKPLLSGLVPMTVLVICEILLSAVMIKSPLFRKIVCGRPIVVISKGKIVQSELKRLRMSIDELWEELRSKDVFSLDDVMYAIVETNGTLSVLKKPEKDSVTNGDMNIKTENKGLETLVISDGSISEFSLRLCGSDKKKLFDILKKEKTDVKDIFVMTMNEKGDYTLIKRSETL